MAAMQPHNDWRDVDPDDRIPVPHAWIPLIPATFALAMILVGWAILSILRP